MKLHEGYISQSSLSKSIKELEKELGITIFTRKTTGITLSPDGAEDVKSLRSEIGILYISSFNEKVKVMLEFLKGEGLEFHNCFKQHLKFLLVPRILLQKCHQ